MVLLYSKASYCSRDGLKLFWGRVSHPPNRQMNNSIIKINFETTRLIKRKLCYTEKLNSRDEDKLMSIRNNDTYSYPFLGL